jgi:uncharacterized protein YegL
MSIDFNKVELDTSNPEPRCPCVLVLDTSGSMGGAPITQLNEGLQTFREALSKDELAMLRVEIAIITFGVSVGIAQEFVTANQFVPPNLAANGGTPMGQAINLALDKINERKQLYKQNGISYYRPWVFLITDGSPGDEWNSAAQRVQADEAKKKIAFFSVGVDGADMSVLGQISSRQPLKLRGANFQEMFVWLSSSLSGVSHSQPGEEVPLQSPMGWGAV